MIFQVKVNATVISFHLNKQRSFNYGQIYVAISRAKTLQGIYALGKIEHKHVRANREVHEENERLRNTYLLLTSFSRSVL